MHFSSEENLCQWINLVEPDRVLWNLFPVQTKYRILRPIANLRMPKKASTFISLNTFLIKERISTDSGSEEKKGSRQIGPRQIGPLENVDAANLASGGLAPKLTNAVTQQRKYTNTA